MNLVNTSKNGGRKLRSERVPNSVFGLGGCGGAAIFGGRGRRAVGGQVFVVDGDALFAVDGLTGGVVECNLFKLRGL